MAHLDHARPVTCASSTKKRKVDSDACGGHQLPLNTTKRLLVALALVALFMVVELVGAVWSRSLALLADVGHMGSDCIALMLALCARWVAQKPAGVWFHFGYARAPVLAAFVNSLALLVLAGWLVLEAVHRFQNPREILTTIMLYTALVGFAANVLAFWVLHSGDQKDLNLRGALLHVMGDLLGSVAAIIGALVIAATGYVAIDAVLTVLVACLIVYAAWGLLRDSGRVLLQGAPAHIDQINLQRALAIAVPNAKIRRLQMWMLTPEEPQLTLHVSIPPDVDAEDACRAFQTVLAHDFRVTESTIQLTYFQ